jgi:hypothetical protein
MTSLLGLICFSALIRGSFWHDAHFVHQGDPRITNVLILAGQVRQSESSDM